jgi:hypothetical protein
MARDLQPQLSETTMATKVNMLKLVQEVHEHANFTTRRPPARMSGLLLLPLRYSAARFPQRKTLTVIIQDPPDIPAPVAIKYLETTRCPSK